MTRLRVLIAAVALMFVAQPAFAKDAINTFGSDKGVAISGLDPVSFFTEGKGLKGKPEFSYQWKGATWLFASQKDLALFKANPEKYAPAWGGYCAVGIANGHVSTHVVEGSFDIHDGKLYLFAEDRNGDFDQYRKEWLETKGGTAQRVPLGNSNWSALKPRVEAGEEAPRLASDTTGKK